MTERRVVEALPPERHEEYWRNPRPELFEGWPDDYSMTQQILIHQVVARSKECKRTRANLGRLLHRFGPAPFQPKHKRALQAAYDADEAAWASVFETVQHLTDEGFTLDPQALQVGQRVVDPEGHR